MSDFITKMVGLLKDLEIARDKKHSKGVSAARKKIASLVEGQLSGLDEIVEFKRLNAHVQMERASHSDDTANVKRGSGSQEAR